MKNNRNYNRDNDQVVINLPEIPGEPKVTLDLSNYDYLLEAVNTLRIVKLVLSKHLIEEHKVLCNILDIEGEY